MLFHSLSVTLLLYSNVFFSGTVSGTWTLDWQQVSRIQYTGSSGERGVDREWTGGCGEGEVGVTSQVLVFCYDLRVETRKLIRCREGKVNLHNSVGSVVQHYSTERTNTLMKVRVPSDLWFRRAHSRPSRSFRGRVSVVVSSKEDGTPFRRKIPVRDSNVL